MKIGVVMPVYLGDYAGAATNREVKFVRAVRSFLDQDYDKKQLIIVSDGCDTAERLYHENFEGCKEIVFTKIDKQPIMAGAVRNRGIELSDADITGYLDSDDVLFGSHLADIARGFGDADWVLFNDYVALDATLGPKRMRGATVSYGCVGTSTVAHRRTLPVSWPNGYSHDWFFIQSMNEKFLNKKHITATGYCVCHVPPILDV